MYIYLVFSVEIETERQSGFLETFKEKLLERIIETRFL